MNLNKLLNLVISVEHDWLCIRTKDQSLLWNRKCSEFPEGMTIGEIVKWTELSEQFDEHERRFRHN